MTHEQILSRLESSDVKSGLWNCHHIGLHSLVLDEKPDGSLTRIFVADPLHTMDRLFTRDGHFTLGAHNHNKRLKFTTLYGDVWQVAVKNTSQFVGTPLFRYEFQSFIETGKIVLSKPFKMLMEWDIVPLNKVKMGLFDYHTVLISSQEAAWLVEEDSLSNVQKWIFSPRDDLRITSEGLYIPMSKADIALMSSSVAHKMMK